MDSDDYFDFDEFSEFNLASGETFSEIEVKEEIDESDQCKNNAKNSKTNYCSYHGCNYKSTRKINLDNHVKGTHEESQKREVLTCQKCDYQTYNEKHLVKHEKGKHNSNPFPCSFDGCDFQSKHIHAVKRHIKTYHLGLRNISPTSCSYDGCDYKSDYRHVVRRHIRTKHLGEQINIGSPCECSYLDCDFKSNYSHVVRRHVKTYHLGERLISPTACSYDGCDYKSDYKHVVRRHIRTRHLGEKIYNSLCECSYVNCDFKSNYSHVVRRHIRTKHLGEKIITKNQRIPCSIEGCGLLARNGTDLRKHNKQVHIKNELFSCTLCKYTTHYDGNLKNHLLGKHNESRVFNCAYNECGYTSNYSQGVKNHAKKVHLGEKSPLVKCDECDYKGSSKSVVRFHYDALHTDKRNSCPRDGCDFTAKWATSINIHIKEYHGEGQQLQCSECGYTTYRKTNLVKHNNVVHLKLTEEYFCDQCVFKTTNQSTLNKHIKANIHSDSENMETNFKKENEQSCKEERTAIEEEEINNIKEQTEQNSCEYCSFIASSPNELLLHHANWHKSKPAIQKCKEFNLM